MKEIDKRLQEIGGRLEVKTLEDYNRKYGDHKDDDEFISSEAESSDSSDK